MEEMTSTKSALVVMVTTKALGLAIIRLMDY